MNIKKKINAKDANKVILKQKKENVFIVLQNDMVDQLAENANIKKMQME